MAKITPSYGITSNNIPYARFGRGEKTMQLWSGGPGNNIPKGMAFNRFSHGMTPLLDEYTITLLTRKSGLSQGYTTRDMSDDYAELIRFEFDGHVDLIIGVSYGGIIVGHFAADYPELFDRIVMFMAAHKIDPQGAQLDYRFAELLNQNKPRQAYALISQVIAPNRLVGMIYKGLMCLLAPSMLGADNTETFRRDVLIEAQAELEHDALDAIQRIQVPILIMGGEQDKYFPVEYFQETAAMIPNATLKTYPERGHDLFGDVQAARDILAWVSGELD
jgi:pimeloyl-ACP methyl ester carboxylesterase